ncbi:MAG: cupredoxin domain-containing protein [Mycobacterium sp.]
MRTNRNSVKQLAGLLAVSTAVAAGSAGCGWANTAQTAPSAPSATTSAKAAEATITITDFTFKSPPSVSPGATIAVQNADPGRHSVTADTGDAFNVVVGSGESATFTAPSAPGTYDYHCAYHPMMHGQLIVK